MASADAEYRCFVGGLAWATNDQSLEQAFSQYGEIIDSKMLTFMAEPCPEDIIYKVMSRLPVKSLARFRCVCKLWLNYISDPYLRTIHDNEEPTPIMFQQFTRVNPKKIKISFLRGNTSVQKEPVLELCYKGEYYTKLFRGSCNGLTLVSYEQDPCFAGVYRFAVINPLSKECHDLPPISIKICPSLIELDGPCDAAGIGFDDSTNTLKTVFVILKDPDFDVVSTMVHSSGTSSWREISQFPPYMITGEGVFSHTRLHWLASDRIRKIVYFDVKNEIFGLIDHPKPNEHHWIADMQLVDIRCEVGFAYISPISIKLLILKQKEWVVHCCFDLSVILPQFYVNEVEVLGYWNKDGDILCAYNRGERLFVYTLKSGDVREVEHRDPPKGFTDIRVYQSSLFSVQTSPYLITKGWLFV